MEESVLNDPSCFGQLIRFYDGVCCWEEGSPTPVLHIGWAKPMVASFSKFDAGVRNQMKFSGPPKSENDEQEDEEELDEDGDSNSRSSSEKSLKKMELQSAKMIGLKELLCSEKINTSAIQLQLTAQSQTESKKTLSFDESARPKRSRRE